MAFLFWETFQTFFHPISNFSMHNTLWQGVPQIKKVLSEDAISFYLFQTCLVIGFFTLLTFVLWDSDLLLFIHLSMLFMILQNFISLISLISPFRLERWSMLFDPFYEKNYIILIILVEFFIYLPQIYYIFFTLGWLELYLLFKMWASHGFVVL